MVIRIAGQKTDDDWYALKAKLVPGGTPDEWEEAFDFFFLERLESRYLRPIELLKSGANAQYAGEGFSIVAIQCSLIEFLESTVQGKSYRFRRSGEPPLGPFEYGNSREMFTNFLRNRRPFSTIFDQSLANEFYQCVRCALLHEARTRKPWVIRAGGATGNFIEFIAGEKIIRRNRLHDALREFVKYYRSDLSTNKAMQEAFVRKFDSLCL